MRMGQLVEFVFIIKIRKKENNFVENKKFVKPCKKVNQKVSHSVACRSNIQRA